MQLLKLVFENCVFTFQDKFFKQLHGAAMGSPCSPVVANIYMEYFKNLALGPELPIPVKDWKRYVDDVFSIIPKGNRNKIPGLQFQSPYLGQKSSGKGSNGQG